MIRLCALRPPDWPLAHSPCGDIKCQRVNVRGECRLSTLGPNAMIVTLTTLVLVACADSRVDSPRLAESYEPNVAANSPPSDPASSADRVSSVAAGIKQLLPTRPLPEPPVDEAALAKLLDPPPLVNVVNVRAGPGSDTAIVAQVRGGDRLREIDRRGDWVEIEVQEADGARGWIKRESVVAAPDGRGSSSVGANLVVRAEYYRITPYDELEISVFNVADLEQRQMVRPDGRIDFPLVGEIMAAGKTPSELRRDIVAGLSSSFEDPEVSVVVMDFGDKRFSVLGEVREPGSFKLDSPVRVIDALAMAGGFTQNADLRSASVVRNGEVLPVSLYRLIKHRDLRQNITLMPRDSIVVPDVSARRVLVLGEVVHPMVVPMREDITLLEAIALARGFKRSAEKFGVLVIRGGIENPEVISVNSEGFLSDGKSGRNLMLEPGDIVYVAKSWWASFADFLDDINVTNQLTYILYDTN